MTWHVIGDGAAESLDGKPCRDCAMRDACHGHECCERVHRAEALMGEAATIAAHRGAFDVLATSRMTLGDAPWPPALR